MEWNSEFWKFWFPPLFPLSPHSFHQHLFFLPTSPPQSSTLLHPPALFTEGHSLQETCVQVKGISQHWVSLKSLSGIYAGHGGVRISETIIVVVETSPHQLPLHGSFRQTGSTVNASLLHSHPRRLLQVFSGGDACKWEERWRGEWVKWK